jgi:hypothetical protein
VSLSLSLSSTFIYFPFGYLSLSISSLVNPFLGSISLSASSLCLLCLFFSLQHSVSILNSSIPFILSLSFSFPLSFSAYFSCTFSTSSFSFHPKISAPYVNILCIMLSNITILFLKSPPLLSVSYSSNPSHCLNSFPHYLSDMCLIRGSFVESATHGVAGLRRWSYFTCTWRAVLRRN